MKDIPLFTTQAGVASLILKEIPYTGRAYIRIQASQMPDELLRECADFCRAVGAERIFATGSEIPDKYSLHCKIIKMCCDRSGVPDTDAALFPVVENTLEQFRQIYNQKMKDVPTAAFMTLSDARNMLAKGNGYFVHRNGKLLGIGIADGDTIHGIAAVLPGAGRDVLLALNHALSGDRILVEVASNNQPAMRLYNQLGFICISEIESWYKIL